MIITIESTDEIVTYNGAPVRIWKGKTSQGTEIVAFVRAVCVRAGQEAEAELGASLKMVEPPVEAKPAPLDLNKLL